MRLFKQEGLGFSTWFIIIALIGAIVVMFLRVFPVYLEHFSVKNSLDAIEHNPQVQHMTQDAIKENFRRLLSVNSVHNVHAKDLVVDDTMAGHRLINITYEVRKPLLGNIDLVIHFSDTVTINVVESQ